MGCNPDSAGAADAVWSGMEAIGPGVAHAEVGRRKGIGAGESCLGDGEGFAAKGDGSGAWIGTEVKSDGICNGVNLRISPRGCVEGEPINSAGQIPGAGGLAG